MKGTNESTSYTGVGSTRKMPGMWGPQTSTITIPEAAVTGGSHWSPVELNLRVRTFQEEMPSGKDLATGRDTESIQTAVGKGGPTSSSAPLFLFHASQWPMDKRFRVI